MDEFDDIDLSQFGFHEQTEEEIQERKIKQTKSLEELVLEHNMILDGDRIYLNQFHYDKHQNYINSLSETKSTISL